MTDTDTMDRALAQALGPEADDIAPLSQAVLSRLAATGPRRRIPLSDVLAAPLPATAAMLGFFLLTGAMGYALTPVDLDEVTALVLAIGVGL